MSVRSEFAALLAALEVSFAADAAIVSVETERFGTITRGDVARLMVLVRQSERDPVGSLLAGVSGEKIRDVRYAVVNRYDGAIAFGFRTRAAASRYNALTGNRGNVETISCDLTREAFAFAKAARLSEIIGEHVAAADLLAGEAR